MANEKPDSVALTIDGKSFVHWNELEIHLALDAHHSVGFYAPFDPTSKEHRDTFRPFSFKPLIVKVDGEDMFTGMLIDVKPSVSAESSTVDISAYSKPAALDDTDVPVSALPIEANKLTLRSIAEQLARPLGITVVIEGDDGAPFKRVKTRQKRHDTSIQADEKIGSFLAELARQRGRIVSSTVKGELYFPEIVKTGSPVATLTEGQPPLVEVDVTFDPQSYFSEITGFTSATRGNKGAKYTERNQRIAGGVTRALSFKLEDVDKGDAPAAVKAKMARMFGNVCALVVSVPTWRDPSGELWKPNTTIKLKAPSAMVYREYEFLIRDVWLRQSRGDAAEKTASLGLVLPGSFSGEQPASLPWDES